MRKETITFRMPGQKRKEIDAIAAETDRDRSFILNEAIDAYLEIHHWQINHIKMGLKQADRSDFASDNEVESSLRKWRK
jgi:predicted transcriptional regulator